MIRTQTQVVPKLGGGTRCWSSRVSVAVQSRSVTSGKHPSLFEGTIKAIRLSSGALVAVVA